MARPRIIASLERLRGGEVALLSAPPGFGKTVTLASWYESHASRGLRAIGH